MKETAALRRRILSRRAPLAVVGGGHSTVSLAFAAADAGFQVTAFDVDISLIEDLRGGVLGVSAVTDGPVRAGLATNRFGVSDDIEAIQSFDVVAICEPVPIRDETAELDGLEETCQKLCRNLRPGQLVILESNVPPGTTEEVARPALESAGLSADHDFLLVYSPERVAPGRNEPILHGTPRVVGGMTREATGVAALFFGQIVDKVVQVSSCRAAEMVLLLEDTFRQVNVGLVNEMAIFCNEQGIDVWEVIEAAATNPLEITSFHPGPGVGAARAPVNGSPVKSGGPENSDRTLRLLRQAHDINRAMPDYLATRIERSLHEAGRNVTGAKVLALGVTAEPEVGEAVESPALKVLDYLRRKGAKIAFHDPYVSEVMMNGALLACSPLTERSVQSADLVALLTPHSAYDLDWIAEHAGLIFDARNAFGPDHRPNVVRL